MKKSKKISILIVATIILATTNTDAHSGRTDSNGGHKDKNNVSGLGYYHYHCGGYPAHLHENGVCPYSSNSSSESDWNSEKNSSTSNYNSNQSNSNNNQNTSNSNDNQNSSNTSNDSTSSNSNQDSQSSSNGTNSPDSSNTSNSLTTNNNTEPTETVQKEITAEEIKINETIESMEIGESKEITVTILPDNAEDKSVTWKSSNDRIAKVSEEGKITAKESGTVEITATTSNGKTATIKVDIKEPIIETEHEETSMSTNTIPASTETVDSSSEESDTTGDILTLGLLGGGAYWIYKKVKKSKNKHTK